MLIITKKSEYNLVNDQEIEDYSKDLYITLIVTKL